MQTIFLVGPTAVGKSAVALELVHRLDGEIVSADSMQVYRGMDIGTAKPSVEERQQVRHHLIDVCEVSEVFDAKQFVDLATNAISAIHKRGKTALVVGGTGLYVRALRQGLFTGPGRDPALRAKLEMMSVETLAAELERVDPLTAAKIDRKNPRRLVRALEVFYSTGKPIAEQQQQWSRGKACCAPTFGLVRDRAELHARIERRIDEQIAAGWVEEVRRLLDAGLGRNPTALQAAGYRELVAHVRGELTLPDAMKQIKIRTRQLAKRQMTWFRREPDLIWLELSKDESPEQTAKRITD